MRFFRAPVVVLIVLLGAAASRLVICAQPDARAAAPDLALFFTAAGRDDRAARDALKKIAASWRDGYAALIIDLARLMPASAQQDTTASAFPSPLSASDDDDLGIARSPGRSGAPELPTVATPRQRLLEFLARQTNQRLGTNLGKWRVWLWSRPYDPHPSYAAFKAAVYRTIDLEMAEFFPAGVKASIRLDEIDWGGVKVNGIPPLDHPKRIPAAEAAYLKDGNIVFGVYEQGEARAYPRRILGWHELVRDRVGGTELTLVYCTLCGTAIPYRSVVGGLMRTLGTSGLLYRSNKLMFDEETYSLWSTLDGTPVVGPLVGTGLALEAHSIVTTTWGEWKADHPETTVLSLDTGYKRDYTEGAAYRDYFSNDRLMFQVPAVDTRLKNKAEVLVMRLPLSATERVPVAIAVDLLKKTPLYHVDIRGRRIVVVTTSGGANRVYEADGIVMKTLDGGSALDDQGRRWIVTESALVPSGHDAAPLARLPAARAFWFGWYAQFPDTFLMK